MFNKSLPRVLMLGWEFPPIINGGLGVACHDLSSALSELTRITMVIPKSSQDFKMKNVNLIGANNLDVRALEPFHRNENLPFALHEIPVDLNPYYSEKATGSHGNALSSSSGKLQPFNITDLYGGDVIRKVFHFADVAAALSAKLDFDVIHAHDWMTMIA